MRLAGQTGFALGVFLFSFATAPVQAETWAPGDQVAEGDILLPYNGWSIAAAGLHGLWLEPQVTDRSGAGFTISIRQFDTNGQEIDTTCVRGDDSHGLATPPYGQLGGYSSCLVDGEAVRLQVSSGFGFDLHVRLLVDEPPIPLPRDVLAQRTLYMPGPFVDLAMHTTFGNGYRDTAWSMVADVEGLAGQRLAAESVDNFGAGYWVRLDFYDAQNRYVIADCMTVFTPGPQGSDLSSSYMACGVPSGAAVAHASLWRGHDVTVTLRLA